jgi:murein DD-endopeptidase MepM/ murein hydrolase activator NlpD
MPSCQYCSGHRGIDFATERGLPVLAAATGSVTFVGTVAGTRYVVVRHRGGVRATYGGLATTSNGLAVDGEVAAGAVIGSTGERLYFGLRADDPEESPIDPTPLLGRWRYRARLLPSDGQASRPPPAPRLVCGNGSGSR